MLRKIIFASLLLGIIVGAGCASIKSHSEKFKNPFAPKPIPARILAYWQPGLQNLPSGESKRGFTGRVYFHDNKTSIPLKIDGMVYVYAYDEASPDPSKIEADYTVMYTTEMLKEKYSKSDFGHSYSLWVPWINQSDEQQKVSIFVKYIPSNGSAILSEQATVYLPGKNNPILASKDDPNLNRLVSYQDSSTDDSRMIRQVGGLRDSSVSNSEFAFMEHPISGHHARPNRFTVKTIDSKGSSRWSDSAANTMIAESREIGTVPSQMDRDLQPRIQHAPQPISRATMAGNAPELRERPREIEYESIQDTIARNLRNQQQNEQRNMYSQNDSYANANANRRYEEPSRYYDETAPGYADAYRESDVKPVRYREYDEEIPSYHERDRITGAEYREQYLR